MEQDEEEMERANHQVLHMQNRMMEGASLSSGVLLSKVEKLTPPAHLPQTKTRS